MNVSNEGSEHVGIQPAEVTKQVSGTQQDKSQIQSDIWQSQPPENQTGYESIRFSAKVHL